MVAKRIIWRLESDRYALTTSSLHDMGKQMGDYYEGKDPERMGYRVIEKLRGHAWEKFAAMNLFFVKVSRDILREECPDTNRFIRLLTSCSLSRRCSISAT